MVELMFRKNLDLLIDARLQGSRLLAYNFRSYVSSACLVTRATYLSLVSKRFGS